jgi:hypothetical protein
MADGLLAKSSGLHDAASRIFEGEAMASIYKQLTVEVDADTAWLALRRVGDAHQLFTPVLVGSRLIDDTRTVTFGNGMVLRERILDVDDERCRVAYTAMDAPGMLYHHASMGDQVRRPGPLPRRVDYRLSSTGSRREHRAVD